MRNTTSVLSQIYELLRKSLSSHSIAAQPHVVGLDPPQVVEYVLS